MIKKYVFIALCAGVLLSCSGNQLAGVASDALKPTLITETTPNDTDDPAIWVDTSDYTKSLVLGTDKDTNGGLYLFNLEGKILNHIPLKRPNNVDVAYGLIVNGRKLDIAVVTERETNQIRVFSMPDFKLIDNGGIDVFTDTEERSPMGIALYTRKSDGKIYAIVGRKSGPKEGYLYQYELKDNGKGQVTAQLVRKFGTYSGKKEVEAIAVDNELGYVYYSDETFGVHKYNADPVAENQQELTLFADRGFVSDHEGISIYKATDSTGYILVSNQQKNSFMIYPREGAEGKPHHHPLLKEVPMSTIESDGSEVTSLPVTSDFPKGVFVAMSNGKVFHYYDWRLIQERIEK